MERVVGPEPSDGRNKAVKKILSNEYNVLTARVFLGVLLILSSSGKLTDPSLFAASIENYRILTGTSAVVLATVIPWMELFCGLFILSGVILRGSALLAGVLLTVFTFAVISALIRGLDISCGCFTQDPTASKIGWLKVAENTLLIGVAAFLYYSRNMRFSLEHYVRSTGIEEPH